MVSRVSSFDSATIGAGAIVNEVVLTYNNFGQLTNDQQSHAGAVSGSTAKVQYAYANGSANTIRQNTLTYPNGRVLNMNYGTASSMADALSRIAALVDTNGTTQLSTYSYLGMGAPVEVAYPVPNIRYTLIGTAGGNDPDTGDIYYGLDRFSRIKDVTWRNYTTATNVVRLLHGYDAAGNRLYRKDLAANAAAQRFDELYTYDGSYRLAYMRRGTLNATNTAIAGGTLRAQQCFTLDSTGNWLGFRSDTNGDGTWDLVQSRTANTVNEITDITNTTGAAWVDPAYNTVGNMTTLPQPADPTKSYTATYDAWNRLVKLADGANTVADYAYDGRKFRVVSRSYTAGVLSETRHHYYTAGWQCVEERLGTSPDSAAADLQYVWGPRCVDALVLRDKSSERLFAMQDANWNVVAIADASSVVQERYAYSPYGVPVFLTPTFTSRASSSFTWQRLFTGQTYDTQTGLHYFRNRMLHSQVGTFMTRDPIGYADGNSLLQYVRSSPLNAIDADGTHYAVSRVIVTAGKSRNLKPRCPKPHALATFTFSLKGTWPCSNTTGVFIQSVRVRCGRKNCDATGDITFADYTYFEMWIVTNKDNTPVGEYTSAIDTAEFEASGKGLYQQEGTIRFYCVASNNHPRDGEISQNEYLGIGPENRWNTRKDLNGDGKPDNVYGPEGCQTSSGSLKSRETLKLWENRPQAATEEGQRRFQMWWNCCCGKNSYAKAAAFP